MDITRATTQTFKQGVRDSKAWGFGNNWFWFSISTCETANYDRASMIQVGCLGIAMQIALIRLQYRGG